MVLVELAKYYNGFEAGVVRGRLRAEGIEAYLFDFDTALEGAGFVVPVRLMVDDEDLKTARAILNESGNPEAG